MGLRGEALWVLTLYRDAGEGGGCLSVPRRALPSGGPPNAERAAEEAGRRARAKIRRYAAANRLNRLGTLTYRGEGCHDPVRLRDELAAFFREAALELRRRHPHTRRGQPPNESVVAHPERQLALAARGNVPLLREHAEIAFNDVPERRAQLGRVHD